MRERGARRKPKKTRSTDTGTILTSPTCPQFQCGPQSSHTVLLSLGHKVEDFAVSRHREVSNLQPSLLPFWEVPHPLGFIQAYFLEVLLSPYPLLSLPTGKF